jgi:hypothetical protein
MPTKTSKTTKPAKLAAKKNKSVKAAKPAAAKKSAAPTVVKVRHVRVNPVAPERRAPRPLHVGPQYAYMNPPGAEHVFEVGDTVEVFCDHEKNNERIRGWIKGIVVQVDNKMVAVQFRSNVFLTDGWMVPDRILWYPLTSDQIRATGIKKAGKREFIPEY